MVTGHQLLNLGESLRWVLTDCDKSYGSYRLPGYLNNYGHDNDSYDPVYLVISDF